MRTPLTILHSIIAILAFCVIAGVLYTYSLWRELPDISNPESLYASQSIVFTDAANNELFRFYTDQDRTNIELSYVPQHFINAIIAIEDKRFFDRGCIDIRSLTRAAIANLTDYKSQGGSTITQQLARTALLHRGKTFERKFRELMLACQLERRYSKEEILELYINWISFGHGISGLQQASQRYFGVSAADLNLAQIAVLASLPQRPSYFSPYGPHRRTTLHPDLHQRIREQSIQSADEITDEDLQIGLIGTNVRIGDSVTRVPGRSDHVLKAMYDQGYILASDYSDASQKLATLNVHPPHLLPGAPHLVLTLYSELEQWLQNSSTLWQQGLTVQTTLNPQLQKLAREVVSSYKDELSQSYNAHNSALVAVDLQTNAVLAYVGNTDFYDQEHAGQIDMVRMPRQTGSVFKPIVYAALMERKGYSSESYIYDKPLDNAIYRPFRSGYYGRMTVRTALARSRNVPAIRAFYLAGGEDFVLQVASLLGVRTPLIQKQALLKRRPRFEYGWPLAIGSAESSLLEMTQAYSIIARNGTYLPLSAVRMLQGGSSAAVFPERKHYRVMRPSTATQLASILADDTAREPLWRHSMKLDGYDASIKTGTSNICKKRTAHGSCSDVLPNNSWTIGFTDRLLVGVWVGNADNTPLTEEGVAILSSVPLWKSFMTQALPLLSR